MIEHLSQDGERIAVMAVCQPGIPVMAAASLMAMAGNPRAPGVAGADGLADGHRPQPQAAERARRASGRSRWFENNVVVRVPWPNRGFMRRVYPGFLQLSSFLAMNIDRHVDAHVNQFRNLVRGDGDSAEQHRVFYDEYLAVMDLTAEFYLQTIERVFQKRLMAQRRLPLPRHADRAGGDHRHRADDRRGREGRHHRPRPDRGGARHGAACRRDRRRHYVAQGVGHYGVFNGSRWRSMIQPEVRDFIRAQRAARLTPRWPRPSASATRRSRSGCAATPAPAAWCCGWRRPARGPTLTLPPGVPLAQARAFLRDQEGWLRRHLAARPGGAAVGDGSVLPFGDATLTLRGHAGAAMLRAGGDAATAGRPPALRAAGAAWLREEARRACVAGGRAARGAPRRAAPGASASRDPRARWGSCTAAGDLMFSWRLVMAPAAVLDYVVAHEVAHLAELNHSPRFWAVVRRLCPDYDGAARLAAPARRRRCTATTSPPPA